MVLRPIVAALLALAVLPLAACKSKNAPFIDPFDVDVNRQTTGWGLRKLDPGDYPDMKLAWMNLTNLERAIDKSLLFLSKPSSNRFYPSGKPGDTITHGQVQATLVDIKSMIRQNITPEQFQQQILARYDVYTSVGFDDLGSVWFTGYFTPIYTGSRTRTAEFQYPIYSRPADLASDPITGEVIGSYPKRSELVASGKLNGLELLWFRTPLEPFMIQVQGSAKVITPSGETIYVGYAGHNGGAHRGLGMMLVEEGVLSSKQVSLPAVLDYFQKYPERLNSYILRNDRFTFQKIYTEAEAAEWPTGSLNVQVTTDRSLATDKSIFPRASFTFIDVPMPTAGGTMVPMKHFALDQDAGGAIRAAGRADVYMGIGDAAGNRAGLQFAQGRLYYLFLKPEFVAGGAGAPGVGGVPESIPIFPGAVQRQ